MSKPIYEAYILQLDRETASLRDNERILQQKQNKLKLHEKERKELEQSIRTFIRNVEGQAEVIQHIQHEIASRKRTGGF